MPAGSFSATVSTCSGSQAPSRCKKPDVVSKDTGIAALLDKPDLHLKPSLIFIVGPTASGKSDLALNLACVLKAEIISADSMLVYRGMDIGTAKPSREDQARVPHHFIDIADPGDDFSVFEYRRRVLDLVQSPGSREKVFVVVGGSGLYVKALLNGISEKPGANPEIRKRLLEESRKDGFDILKDRLRGIDPVYAEIARDERRVLRALEVHEMTGKSLTEWDRETVGLRDEGYPIRSFGLRWEKDAFRTRVERRTRAMLAAGLLEEVKQLLQKPWSRNPRQAIGYAEAIQVLNGELPPTELEPLIIKNTLALGKRQMTWFRKEKGVRWFDLKDETDLEKAKGEILNG